MKTNDLFDYYLVNIDGQSVHVFVQEDVHILAKRAGTNQVRGLDGKWYTC